MYEDPGDRRPGARISGTCPICSATGLRVLPFRYSLRDRFLYGVQCLACSAVFLDLLPSEEEIAGLYHEEYFTKCSETCGAHGPAAYMEMAGSSASERKAAARRLDRCMRKYVGESGNLVEVGCGPGFFLAELRSLGWNVKGLEVSEFAVRHATESLDLDVRLGSIESHTFPADSVDAVFMGDVLEHLSSPIACLKSIRRWLKPGGVLIIAIPSTLNLLSAKLGLWLYGVRSRFKTLRIPPYHLFEYTPGSVKVALGVAGFRTVHLRQSAVPIRRMGLRGSKVENLGKVTLQTLAHLTASLLNRGGDRLFIAALKTTNEELPVRA